MKIRNLETYGKVEHVKIHVFLNFKFEYTFLKFYSLSTFLKIHFKTDSVAFLFVSLLRIFLLKYYVLWLFSSIHLSSTYESIQYTFLPFIYSFIEHDRIVRIFIEKDESVNADGDSMLMFAVAKGNIRPVCTMYICTAPSNVKNNKHQKWFKTSL